MKSNLLKSEFIFPTALPETVQFTPENRPVYPKGKDRTPTIHFEVLLLLEEIRRSPVEVGSFSHYLQGFEHPRWCRNSSINRMLVSWSVNYVDHPPKVSRLSPFFTDDNGKTFRLKVLGLLKRVLCSFRPLKKVQRAKMQDALAITSTQLTALTNTLPNFKKFLRCPTNVLDKQTRNVTPGYTD